MQAVSYGVEQAQFWEWTSEEIAIAVEGAQQQEARWFETLLSIGWRIALWGRVKDFPSWASVKPKKAGEAPAEPQTMSWQSFKAGMKNLATKTGTVTVKGQVQPTPVKKKRNG